MVWGSCEIIFKFQSTWNERKPSMDLFNRTVVHYFKENYSNQEIPFEKPEVNETEWNTVYSKFNSVLNFAYKTDT